MSLVLQVFGKLKTRIAIGSSLNIMMIVVPIAIIYIAILSNNQLELIKEQLIFIIILVMLTLLGAKLASYGIRNIPENRIRQAFIAILVIIWIRYLFDLII